MGIRDFFIENEIKFQKIDFLSNPFSVVATEDLVEGDVIVRIPKDSVLSIRNTAIADIIEELDFKGILGLGLAVMYERSQKEKSPWFQYLNAIPLREYLPLFWSNEEAEYLQNTDVGLNLPLEVEMLKSDFQTHILPIVGKYDQLDADYITEQHWLEAVSIISSRAFEVDEFHGESLVPFADLFNHRTANENVHCEFEQEEEEEDWEDMEDGDDADSIPEAVPVQDEEEINNGILEMVVVRPCKKGEEVFNTYGDHSNSSLLRLYGFVEKENPFSCVFVNRLQISDLLPDSKVADSVLRIKFWDSIGSELASQIAELPVDEHGTVLVDQLGEDDDDEMEEYNDNCCEDGDGEYCNTNMQDADGCCENGDGGCCNDQMEETDAEGCADFEADGEELVDDFYFESTGQESFALRAYCHIMLMDQDEFEEKAADLDTLVELFVGLRKPPQTPKGKGKKTVADEVQALLKQIAGNRLAAYKELPEPAETLTAKHWGWLLREDEKKILIKFLQK